MPNLTRLDPFQVAIDPFDEMFKGFFRPVRLEQTDVQIKMDLKEDDRAYTVHAEIPGVRKEDIHVTINANQVSITAETKQEREVKEGQKTLRSERYYGKVSRSFSLGSEVDEERAQAKYSDGILELTLPKKIIGSVKKLSIS